MKIFNMYKKNKELTKENKALKIQNANLLNKINYLEDYMENVYNFSMQNYDLLKGKKIEKIRCMHHITNRSKKSEYTIKKLMAYRLAKELYKRECIKYESMHMYTDYKDDEVLMATVYVAKDI